MASSLAGNVALIGCGPTNLVVRFFTPGTQVEIMKAASVTNAAGNFTVLGVTAGIYDVGVKSQHSLSILSPNEVFVDGVPTNVNFGNLNRGDLDANDICNMLDSGILAATRALPQFWGDCVGYAGDWLLPCDITPAGCGGVAGKGASYKLIGGQSV